MPRTKLDSLVFRRGQRILTKNLDSLAPYLRGLRGTVIGGRVGIKVYDVLLDAGTSHFFHYDEMQKIAGGQK